MTPLNVLNFLEQDPEFVASAFGRESLLSRRRESKRLDVVIDGQPLRALWREWEQPEWNFDVPVADLVTRLSPSSRAEGLRQLRQLRGPAAGQSPVIAELLYCGACFDKSDGILGVQIDRNRDTVTWRRLGWIDELEGITDDALIPNAPDFTFDVVAYDRELDQARALLAGIFPRS
jgi:hypothetical protein